MEEVVDLINKFCTFPAIEKLILFKLVIFNYLTGNDDHHLKNFSIITEDGKVKLSPCYDLLNTTIEYRKPDEEIALPLKGKKKRLTYNIIEYFGLGRCELTAKSVDKVLDTKSSAIPVWNSLMDSSFLSNGMKEKYLKLLETRLHNLRIT